jgi:hypothetical protein
MSEIIEDDIDSLLHLVLDSMISIKDRKLSGQQKKMSVIRASQSFINEMGLPPSLEEFIPPLIEIFYTISTQKNLFSKKCCCHK